MLAERDLEIEVMKEIIRKKRVSPHGRREQYAYACGRGIAKQRACGLIGMARSTFSYELRQPVKDAPVLAGDATAVIAVPALRLSPHSDQAFIAPQTRGGIHYAKVPTDTLVQSTARMRQVRLVPRSAYQSERRT
jgi:hypothetical protein